MTNEQLYLLIKSYRKELKRIYYDLENFFIVKELYDEKKNILNLKYKDFPNKLNQLYHFVDGLKNTMKILKLEDKK